VNSIDDELPELPAPPEARAVKGNDLARRLSADASDLERALDALERVSIISRDQHGCICLRAF